MKQSTWWQSLLPQLCLSAIAGRLANLKTPWFKNWAIATFMRHFQVALDEAEQEDYRQYPTFNAFFTRKLKSNARPLSHAAVISPIDGQISQIGTLTAGQIVQAKGKSFSAASLLGDEKLAAQFVDGSFLTGYLAPKDYHRFHMPLNGRLAEMRYIPGKLFSVNEISVTKIERLFARNERVVAIFDTDLGPFAYVAVGALIVGSIHMHWHGIVNPHNAKKPCAWTYANQEILLTRGEECGFFQLGSTVILLFPSNAVQWEPSLHAGSVLKMGQAIGRFQR